MATMEHHILHGICLRLIHGLPPSRPEALVLVRWMTGRPDLFGPLPPLIAQTRRGPVLDAQGWGHVASHLADRLAAMPEAHDTALARLDTIAAHLDHTFEEAAILRHLALQHRQGPLADFTAMLQREIGASTEAVIALCCNLDEIEVWTALAPLGRLVTIGLVQTDSTLAILRDDPYTLSGLLLALLSPPHQRPSIPVSGHRTTG